MNSNKNFILRATFEFSLLIIKYCEILINKKKYAIADQLIRSGTSIGAHVHEVQHPESRADFIHKMKTALKEASETDYWLRICHALDTYPDCKDLLVKLDPIMRVLSKIITSSKH